MKFLYSISLLLVITACGETSFKAGAVKVEKTSPNSDAKPEVQEKVDSTPPDTAVTPETESIPKVVDPAPPAPIVPPVIPPVVLHCGDADSKAKMVTGKAQKFVFDKTTEKCDFRLPYTAGGSGIGNGMVTGFRTTTKDLPLPAGEVCEIAITSSTANMKYDDMLVLDINKTALLISSTSLAAAVDKVDGLYQWDVLSPNILGKKFDFDSPDIYCINDDKNECFVPHTEKVGPMKVNVPPAKIAPIAKALLGKDKTSLNLTITGDNDDKIDCMHEAFDLSVTFTYLPAAK